MSSESHLMTQQELSDHPPPSEVSHKISGESVFSLKLSNTLPLDPLWNKKINHSAAFLFCCKTLLVSVLMFYRILIKLFCLFLSHCCCLFSSKPLLLKGQSWTSPLCFSKWYYCWRRSYKDNWIVSVFPRDANNNKTGQDVSLFNHLVGNRKGSPVNLPFPGWPHVDREPM